MSEGRQSPRGRLAIALGAALLLVALVVVVVAAGSSSEEEITNECILAWNADPVAPTRDGQHAYQEHGYKDTLVARVDADAKLLETNDGEPPPGEPDARCVVVFAAPEFDFEPGFGVFVLADGIWTPLAVADQLSLERIEAIQAEAVPIANATLDPNGLLSQD